MNFKICFLHSVLIDMFSFENMFKPVTQNFVYSVNNLGMRLLFICCSNSWWIPSLSTEFAAFRKKSCKETRRSPVALC